MWSAKMVTGVPRAEKFCDTEDHKVLSEGCESRHNHGHVVVVQDLATPWPTRKPEVIYTDNSLEFGKACEDLSWNHCTSTPHRSETNGTAERRVRGSKEGTSAVLLQSGLDESWWVDSMECYCYLRNKISCLMGRHLVRGGLEYHLMARLFRLERLSNVTLFLPKDLSRLQFGRKPCQVYSLDVRCMREESGKRHNGCRH